MSGHRTFVIYCKPYSNLYGPHRYHESRVGETSEGASQMNRAGQKVTVPDIRGRKSSGEKIVALTAYDFTFASLLDEAGVDLILVGDSLGTVVQGHSSTIPVTLDQMVYHTQCVARGARRGGR